MPSNAREELGVILKQVSNIERKSVWCEPTKRETGMNAQELCSQPTDRNFDNRFRRTETNVIKGTDNRQHSKNTQM